MNKAKPNFFIIGAPKCGTTSWADWLGEHSAIYMSPAKEPHFFNRDDNNDVTPTMALYEKLFAEAKPCHKAIGEASVWYLHSNVAVTKIERFSPKSRYIVCLRDPTEMAYALHEQQVVSGNENVAEFSTAWRLSDDRLQGKSVGWFCREPRHLAYGTACKLGDQLERLLSIVESERVLTIVLDDVKKNPRHEYLRVLNFLGVEDDGRVRFPVSNSAKERKSTALRRAVQVAGMVKRKLGIYRGFGLLNSIDRKNVKTRARKKISPALRQELQRHFEPDILKLEKLLDRDLSCWLEL